MIIIVFCAQIKSFCFCNFADDDEEDMLEHYLAEKSGEDSMK
jgi:hypothetical protein